MSKLGLKCWIVLEILRDNDNNMDTFESIPKKE